MKIILVALVFNGLDVITGIIGAIRNGETIKSNKLRDGLFKKVGFIFCYVLGIVINYAETILTLPFSVNLVPVICTYAIVTEVFSIIENISKINPDILPEKIKDLIGYKGGE